MKITPPPLGAFLKIHPLWRGHPSLSMPPIYHLPLCLFYFVLLSELKKLVYSDSIIDILGTSQNVSSGSPSYTTMEALEGVISSSQRGQYLNIYSTTWKTLLEKESQSSQASVKAVATLQALLLPAHALVREDRFMERLQLRRQGKHNPPE